VSSANAAEGTDIYARQQTMRGGLGTSWARAYAYRVPSNPHNGEWSTLLRRERVRIGDRVKIPVRETLSASVQSCPERVVRDSQHQWEVIAVEAADDDGRVGAVRGFGGPHPVWDGVLVVQQVE
jgi:hypothetical protein